MKLLDNKWTWIFLGVGILWMLRKVANQPKAARTLPPESAPFAVKPVFSAPLPENEGFVPSEPETPAPPPKPAPRAPEYDPLAELARIAQSGSDWSAPPRAADPLEHTSPCRVASPQAAGHRSTRSTSRP